MVNQTVIVIGAVTNTPAIKYALNFVPIDDDDNGCFSFAMTDFPNCLLMLYNTLYTIL